MTYDFTWLTQDVDPIKLEEIRNPEDYVKALKNALIYSIDNCYENFIANGFVHANPGWCMAVMMKPLKMAKTNRGKRVYFRRHKGRK